MAELLQTSMKLSGLDYAGCVVVRDVQLLGLGTRNVVMVDEKTTKT
jgi:hypothetical protein